VISRILNIAGKGLDKFEAKLVDWTRQLEAVAPRNIAEESEKTLEEARTAQRMEVARRQRGIDESKLVVQPAFVADEQFVFCAPPKWAANTELKEIESQASRCANPTPENRAWWKSASLEAKTTERMKRRAALGREGYPRWRSKAERNALAAHRDAAAAAPNGGINPDMANRIHIARQRLAYKRRRLAEVPLVTASTPLEERAELRAARYWCKLEVLCAQQSLTDLRDRHTRSSRKALKARIAELESKLASTPAPLAQAETNPAPDEFQDPGSCESCGRTASLFRGLCYECESDADGNPNTVSTEEADRYPQLEVGQRWVRQEFGRELPPVDDSIIVTFCFDAPWAAGPLEIEMAGGLNKVQEDDMDRYDSREEFGACHTRMRGQHEIEQAQKAEPRPPVQQGPLPKPALEVGQRWVYTWAHGTAVSENNPASDSIILEITDTEVFFRHPIGPDRPGYRQAITRRTFEAIHHRLRRPEEIS
jgi:hypothetical protein